MDSRGRPHKLAGQRNAYTRPRPLTDARAHPRMPVATRGRPAMPTGARESLWTPTATREHPRPPAGVRRHPWAHADTHGQPQQPAHAQRHAPPADLRPARPAMPVGHGCKHAMAATNTTTKQWLQPSVQPATQLQHGGGPSKCATRQWSTMANCRHQLSCVPPLAVPRGKTNRGQPLQAAHRWAWGRGGGGGRADMRSIFATQKSLHHKD